VTLDDATIVQLHRSYPYHWMGSVSENALRTMIARQQRIYRTARACCVLNHWAARSAIEDYGVAPERVHVVGAGSNRALTPADRDWDTPRFLFVGKDFERKNGSRVVEAFRRVRERHRLATLDIVGQHPRLQGEGIHTHGELRLDRPEDVARLDALFCRATCFVMPSLVEPTGFVHAEALAAGIGSIGTTVGGVKTLIGDAGVTVPPLDVDALEAAMTSFCDPELMREYGRRAVARAPRFTWRAVAERVIRALDLPRSNASNLAEFL
jgi:glycosyltransferase involved in cell wall biosynthesis